MMDPLFSTAISAALFATATIPVVLSRRGRRERLYEGKARGTVSEETVKAMIRCGRAYAVETGDSTMIVVVLDNEVGEGIDVGIEAPISVRVEGSAEAIA